MQHTATERNASAQAAVVMGGWGRGPGRGKKWGRGTAWAKNCTDGGSGAPQHGLVESTPGVIGYQRWWPTMARAQERSKMGLVPVNCRPKSLKDAWNFHMEYASRSSKSFIVGARSPRNIKIKSII